MIVGNGMIANYMKNIDHDSFIFFCSGVSKSNETNVNEFQKEIELLKQFHNTKKCLIYFSSYFVNFDSYLKQPYYKHKLEMEKLIEQHFEDFKIFRLPQVVGHSKNRMTLTNFINNSILNAKSISVHINAVRNLIDIDDVVKIVEYSNNHNLFINSQMNLIGTKNYHITEIIDIMEKVLKKNAIKNIKNNDEVEFDILLSKDMTKIYNNLNIHFDDTYLNKLLTKYYVKGEIIG